MIVSLACDIFDICEIIDTSYIIDTWYCDIVMPWTHDMMDNVRYYSCDMYFLVNLVFNLWYYKFFCCFCFEMYLWYYMEICDIIKFIVTFVFFYIIFIYDMKWDWIIELFDIVFDVEIKWKDSFALCFVQAYNPGSGLATQNPIFGKKISSDLATHNVLLYRKIDSRSLAQNLVKVPKKF